MNLTYDPDRALELLRDLAEKDYPASLSLFNYAYNNYDATQEKLISANLPVNVIVTAAVGDDGDRFENLAFLATVRYVRDDVMYFSNGSMTVALLKILSQERELLKRVRDEYTA